MVMRPKNNVNKAIMPQNVQFNQENGYIVVSTLFPLEEIADLETATAWDNGPTNMFSLMKAYKAVGFDEPLCSDHVPTMAGEDNTNVGYEMKGNLFGIGYLKGLMDGLG